MSIGDSIPDALTTTRADAYSGKGVHALRAGDALATHPLNGYATAWLNASYYGFSIEEKINQLELMDERLAGVLRLHRKGHKPATIASAYGCSERHARRMIDTAVRACAGVLEPDGYGRDEELTQEQREDLLAAADPDAMLVWSMMGHGWRQAEIARWTTWDLSRIKRLSVKAKAEIGEPRYERARRFGATHIAGQPATEAA